MDTLSEKLFFITVILITGILTLGAVTCSKRDYDFKEKMAEAGLQQCWTARNVFNWMKECK